MYHFCQIVGGGGKNRVRFEIWLEMVETSMQVLFFSPVFELFFEGEVH